VNGRWTGSLRERGGTLRPRHRSRSSTRAASFTFGLQIGQTLLQRFSNCALCMARQKRCVCPSKRFRSFDPGVCPLGGQAPDVSCRNHRRLTRPADKAWRVQCLHGASDGHASSAPFESGADRHAPDRADPLDVPVPVRPSFGIRNPRPDRLTRGGNKNRGPCLSTSRNINVEKRHGWRPTYRDAGGLARRTIRQRGDRPLADAYASMQDQARSAEAEK